VNPATGHTYYLLSNSDWTDAQSEALTLGGNLTTVNDAAENTWICQTFTNFGGVTRNLWIGLHAIGLDGGNPNSYSWADGSPSTYRNWASQEPNFSDQYTLIIPAPDTNAGQWNNVSDTTQAGYQFFPAYLNYGVAEVVPEPSAYLYQQLPGHFGGDGSDGITVSADDFQLAQDTLICSLSWWGGYTPPQPDSDEFSVLLYSDNNGQPGTILSGFTIGPIDKVTTGDFVNGPDFYPEYLYSATLNEPFLAQAGVRYWLSIDNPPGNSWLWEASDSNLSPGSLRSSDGGVTWDTSNDYDMAFELDATGRPVIGAVSVDKPVLWPPDHRLVNVTVNYSATEACGDVESSLSLFSNEPVLSTGGRSSAFDWMILDEHHVLLRAERSGSGNGRDYEITITCADSSGNTTSKVVHVTVPKARAIDRARKLKP